MDNHPIPVFSKSREATYVASARLPDMDSLLTNNSSTTLKEEAIDSVNDKQPRSGDIDSHIKTESMNSVKPRSSSDVDSAPTTTDQEPLFWLKKSITLHQDGLYFECINERGETWFTDSNVVMHYPYAITGWVFRRLYTRGGEEFTDQEEDFIIESMGMTPTDLCNQWYKMLKKHKGCTDGWKGIVERRKMKMEEIKKELIAEQKEAEEKERTEGTVEKERAEGTVVKERAEGIVEKERAEGTVEKERAEGTVEKEVDKIVEPIDPVHAAKMTKWVLDKARTKGKRSFDVVEKQYIIEVTGKTLDEVCKLRPKQSRSRQPKVKKRKRGGVLDPNLNNNKKKASITSTATTSATTSAEKENKKGKKGGSGITVETANRIVNEIASATVAAAPVRKPKRRRTYSSSSSFSSGIESVYTYKNADEVSSEEDEEEKKKERKRLRNRKKIATKKVLGWMDDDDYGCPTDIPRKSSK